MVLAEEKPFLRLMSLLIIHMNPVLTVYHPSNTAINVLLPRRLPRLPARLLRRHPVRLTAYARQGLQGLPGLRGQQGLPVP